MEELGEFGFWLAVGLVVAAMIVAGAQKERDKEREKQATVRVLLEKEGGSTAEVLAYLRERDAAELQFQRQALGLEWDKGISASGVVGVVVIVLAIVAGFVSLTFTSPRRDLLHTLEQSPSGLATLTPVAVMLAIWAAGFVIAALIWWAFGKKKNDAKPDA